MTVGSRTVEELLDLVDAAVYGDVFDAAVTLDELHRYARVTVGRDELARALATDPALQDVLVERSGVFALRDRAHLLDARRERIAHARRLGRRARRVSRVLRHAPFVRGIALTGSVAAGDARPDADVDLLVVVAPRRLGSAFLLLGGASRLLGRRLFCPNFYLAQGRMTLGDHTVYVGRELAQADGLSGDAGGLRDANPWLEEMFPNLAAARPAVVARAPSRAQRVLEAPLRGPGGERLERWALRVAHDRLRVHHAGAVPDAVVRDLDAGAALRFHGSSVERDAPLRYAERRRAVAAMLEAAGAPSGEEGRST